LLLWNQGKKTCEGELSKLSKLDQAKTKDSDLEQKIKKLEKTNEDNLLKITTLESGKQKCEGELSKLDQSKTKVSDLEQKIKKLEAEKKKMGRRKTTTQNKTPHG